MIQTQCIILKLYLSHSVLDINWMTVRLGPSLVTTLLDLVRPIWPEIRSPRCISLIFMPWPECLIYKLYNIYINNYINKYINNSIYFNSKNRIPMTDSNWLWQIFVVPVRKNEWQSKSLTQPLPLPLNHSRKYKDGSCRIEQGTSLVFLRSSKDIRHKRWIRKNVLTTPIP